MSTASYGIGTASRDGYAFSPRISVAVGFTGMIRYPCICMYFGTRCASFAGSFEQPTTAIVRMRSRIFRTSVSSTISSRPSGRRRANRLRFRWEHPTDRLLQGRGDVQRHRFFRSEPAGLGMFFVRDPGLALPARHEEEVMSKEVARGRIDVLVDSEELRLDGSDPELFLKLSDQGARRFLARHQVASESIPHAGKPDGAGPLPQEHPPSPHDEARRRDMNHSGTKARRGYSSFGSARLFNSNCYRYLTITHEMR